MGNAASRKTPMQRPVRYKVSKFIEEGQCSYCGCPLVISDTAYEHSDYIAQQK